MKHEYAGLLKERMPSGAFRYRVRVEGESKKRIRIFVDPNHPKFGEHYHAARLGFQMPPEPEETIRAVKNSIGWLCDKHLDWLAREVSAGQADIKTLQKRTGLLNRLRKDWGAHNAATMPTSWVIRVRDEMNATPAAADSMVEAIRVVYKWAGNRTSISINPAVGVPKIDRGKGGAKPWTADDLRRFKAQWPPGTTPYLCLTILMFTACRIGDARMLGRQHEFVRDGVRGLAWQPGKKNSAPMEMPMLPPLYEATRAPTVQGSTYLLSTLGRPFASPGSLSTAFRNWCASAGMPNRSAHGVRKGFAGLIAEGGATEHQIMAILAHTEPRTSAKYTKDARRWRLSVSAMDFVAGMDW